MQVGALQSRKTAKRSGFDFAVFEGHNYFHSNIRLTFLICRAFYPKIYKKMSFYAFLFITQL